MKQLAGYSLMNYRTLPTKNLYSLILERCDALAKARQGFIVPISSTATEGYVEVQRIILRSDLWFVSFDDRPAHLFDGLDKNTLSILLLSKEQGQPSLNSSKLNRWNSLERDMLFSKLQLHQSPSCQLPGSLPRVGNELDFAIWQKIFSKGDSLASAYYAIGKGIVFYSRKVNAFLQILDFIPEVYDGRGRLRAPSEFKELPFAEALHAKVVLCLLNSSLFRWFIDAVSDGSHLNRREIDNFPFDPKQTAGYAADFAPLAKRLSADLRKNSFERRMSYKHDTLTVQCIVPKHSKPIIDEIDCILAKHYGFTDEELDFIVNYDIKYRLGQGIGEEEAE
jgi:hypothetical protein